MLNNELTDTNKEESVFTFHKNKKGEYVHLGDRDENQIIFILKGQIETTDTHQNKVILNKDHMYSLSKIFDSCKGLLLEDSIYIQFYTDRALPYADLNFIQYMRSHGGTEVEELNSLRIPRLLKKFLAGIISLKKENISSRAIYNIKVQELLFIFRNAFDVHSIFKFLIASVLANTGFKATVLSHYTDSVNVKELADKCFMTPKTFTRHFKNDFGMTPHKWLADRKISNLSNDIFNRSFPLSLILNKYGFLSKNDLRKFCQRNKLDQIIEYLNNQEI